MDRIHQGLKGEGPRAVLKAQTCQLQTTKIDSPSNLIPFLDAWRDLAAGAPMQSPEWLLTWWDIYATPDDELVVLLFHKQGGVLVGLAPLYLQGAGGRATFRLLGSGDACTNHTTWLCPAGWENRVGLEVARFLMDCRSSWKRLLFESVDADATAIHATVDFLVDSGCLRHNRLIYHCWKISLPNTWDDYLQMLSKSLRKRCRKLQQKFFESGIIQIRQVASETELQQGFEILLKLHNARWGTTKEPFGVFDDQRFRTFHETVSRKLLARNQLRLAWLERDGEPIAVEYQLVDAKAVYAIQAGIDLSANEEYSPGKLTMMAAIQFAIAHGCESFDLLRGDEPYKAHWRALPLACYDIRVWHGKGFGRAKWAIWNGYTFAVRCLKSILPPHIVLRGFKLVNVLKRACIKLGIDL